jgi:hypothetical protein
MVWNGIPFNHLQPNPHYYNSITQLFLSKVLLLFFHFFANFIVFPECMYSFNTERIAKNKPQENVAAYNTDRMVHVAGWTY